MEKKRTTRVHRDRIEEGSQALGEFLRLKAYPPDWDKDVEEANQILARIAKLFKGLGGEEGQIHRTIKELETVCKCEINKIRELKMEECAGEEPDALNPRITKLVQAARKSSDEKLDKLAKAFGRAWIIDEKEGGLNDEEGNFCEIIT